MAQIRWTKEAATWLEEIHEFLAQDNPSAAAKVVNGIFEKVQTLASFPRIGLMYRSEPEGEIRILLYGHYRIAYVLKSNDVVEVLGIFHGALEIDQYLP